MGTVSLHTFSRLPGLISILVTLNATIRRCHAGRDRRVHCYLGNTVTKLALMRQLRIFFKIIVGVGPYVRQLEFEPSETLYTTTSLRKLRIKQLIVQKLAWL